MSPIVALSSVRPFKYRIASLRVPVTDHLAACRRRGRLIAPKVALGVDDTAGHALAYCRAPTIAAARAVRILGGSLVAAHGQRGCRAVSGAVQSLFPGFRTEQRHTARPDPCVADWAGLQPSCPDAPATAAGATHTPQHLSDRPVATVEGRQLGNGEAALAPASRCQAIDRNIEAAQFVQGAAKDCYTLAAGRCVGGCHLRPRGSVRAPHGHEARERELVG